MCVYVHIDDDVSSSDDVKDDPIVSLSSVSLVQEICPSTTDSKW